MKEPSATPKSTANLGFPKSARILKSADFRKVYAEGARISGPCFAAFCLAVQRPEGEGPRLGFTVPRAFGRAVSRNRVKRRLRDALRRRLPEIDPRWDVVINPRRLALEASPQDIQRSLDRLISQCGKR
ncbi:MAG: ribonuclease P protein component [Acidobacteriota bacterium]|jgi:ribonuclease P protein component|nr:ribonuclease P protein component [Acidobacteriota bacterium]